MTPDPNDAVARQLELLKKLEGKGVRRGSDLPARPAAAAFGPAGAPPEEARRPRARPLSEILAHAERLGEVAGGGGLWRVTTELTSDGRPTREGYTCPAAAWGGPPAPGTLARLTADAAWGEVDPERILYLDTETTGLATGATSVAFLVGLGRFRPDGRFLLEQFYIDDFAAEPLLIELLDARMRAAEALVTYNGRTFDLPLLTARWVLARRPPRFPKLDLDLLHFARRLWRLRLESCSLGSVERSILRLERMSDLPGHLIPGIWLEAQRGIHPERLVPVFDHHAQDIISMGALAALMGLAAREPRHPVFDHASDQVGLARIAETCGDRAAALERMEAAVLAAREPELEFRLAMHLARAYKRAGRVEEALAIWQARVAECRPHRLDPLIELAKHAEHAERDYAQARRWTLQALEIVQSAADMAAYGLPPALGPAARAEAVAAIRHRLERHERKLARKRRG